MSLAIWWIRRDLRLADNPALMAALRYGSVIPLYIHAPQEEGKAAPGAASGWWLHKSLAALDEGLRARGSRLVVHKAAKALEAIRAVVEISGADAVFWNRQYAPAQIDRDRAIEMALRHLGLHVQSFNASLLFEPWQVQNGEGQPYRVFSPFWKAVQRLGLDQPILAPPALLPALPARLDGLPIEALNLTPATAHHDDFAAFWTPGEEGAWSRLCQFLQHGLPGYKTSRDRPGQEGTSRLSPHLHFGEIGPRQVVRAVFGACRGLLDEHALTYLGELGWREFAHHVLYHFPHTLDRPMNPRWDEFTWPAPDANHWQAWTQGQTGIPLIDAGMRELKRTGWMHNRVRMIAASLLTKNMQMAWGQGERWFWDALVDADLACNVFNWQWVAGCGADAAPWFRIFNPVNQGERFDKEGAYVRHWLPKLARLPARWLHRPWEAPAPVLREAGIELGVDYPRPVVDLAQSRRTALARYSALGGLT